MLLRMQPRLLLHETMQWFVSFLHTPDSDHVPEGVMSIADHAFYQCTALISIALPSSLTSIRNYAFDGTSSLASITLPGGATSIGNRAFQSAGLISINVPSSLTSIGSWETVFLVRVRLRVRVAALTITITRDPNENPNTEPHPTPILTLTLTLIRPRSTCLAVSDPSAPSDGVFCLRSSYPATVSRPSAKWHSISLPPLP